jgi:hypothetical protein
MKIPKIRSREGFERRLPSVLAGCGVAVLAFSASAAEAPRAEEPLGRPGRPYVVGAGQADAAAQSATRVTPRAEELLRRALERGNGGGGDGTSTEPRPGPEMPARAAR